MADMFMDYKRSGMDKQISFKKYLESIGFVDPASGLVGMDDAAQFLPAPGGPELLAIPSRPVTGEVKVKVLLVDFSDRPGLLDPSHYEGLLFSSGIYPSGSMRDYYKEVSLGKVDVTGSVHGWFRMPKPYSYYTNNQSGTKWENYPNNAPRLAEDAVREALARNVSFDASLDKFNRGIVTALFIIHAGRGAEVMKTKVLQGAEIWSHKWNFRNPVEVAPNLSATIYLTVPHDCKVGVCAHELGHLAFEWQDFYDPNYAEDGMEWDGSGVWDLMAGGSYNGDGTRPAHPAALHKMQHGWIAATKVTTSGRVTVRPYTATTGHAVKVVSPGFKPKQYLLMESRRKSGFDFDLPGEGLLVWKVDETKKQFAPAAPGMSLIQADGRNNLDEPDDWNKGDAGDPFPGSSGRTTLSEAGPISTSFPGKKSGVTLKNIVYDEDGVATLDVVFSAIGASSDSTAARPAKKSAAKKIKKAGKAKKAAAVRSRAKTKKTMRG